MSSKEWQAQESTSFNSTTITDKGSATTDWKSWNPGIIKPAKETIVSHTQEPDVVTEWAVPSEYRPGTMGAKAKINGDHVTDELRAANESMRSMCGKQNTSQGPDTADAKWVAKLCVRDNSKESHEKVKTSSPIKHDEEEEKASIIKVVGKAGQTKVPMYYYCAFVLGKTTRTKA